MSVIFKQLCNLLSISNSFSYDIIFPKQLNEFTCSIILLSITNQNINLEKVHFVGLFCTITLQYMVKNEIRCDIYIYNIIFMTQCLKSNIDPQDLPPFHQSNILGARLRTNMDTMEKIKNVSVGAIEFWSTSLLSLHLARTQTLIIPDFRNLKKSKNKKKRNNCNFDKRAKFCLSMRKAR